MLRTSFALLMLLVAGCASTSRAPEWVGGAAPSLYPERGFVTARGTGATLVAAQSAAKAELSRIFSARLESELLLIDRETVVEDVAAQDSEMVDETRISTDLELQGVEVPLVWEDPRSGDFWALAVLDRELECLRLEAEGRTLASELAGAISAGAETHPLAAIRDAIRAVSISRALDGLDARSRVLGTRCVAPRSVGTGELRREMDARRRSVSFVVRADDVDARTGKPVGTLPQLREQIASNLTRRGFQVGPAEGARIVPIEARLRLERVRRGTDWVEYRWEGAAEIGEASDDEPTLIAAQTEGAESHPEPSTARLRARRKGEIDLSRKLDQQLEAFLRAED